MSAWLRVPETPNSAISFSSTENHVDSADDAPVVFGNVYPTNTQTYDLTRGSSTDPSASVAGGAGEPGRHLQLETTTKRVIIDSARTALVVVDMQNFFLHPAARHHPAGLKAYDNLVKKVIPACRKGGIDIIFLNWGLTAHDLAHMPPSLKKVFSRNVAWPPTEAKTPTSVSPVDHRSRSGSTTSTGALSHALGGVAPSISVAVSALASSASGISASTTGMAAAEESTGRSKNAETLSVGLGEDMGTVEWQGEAISLGGMLCRDSWNAALYGELDEVWRQGKDQGKTFLAHKNRLSGLWGQTTPLEQLLQERGITTLLWSGVNTDRCVLASLTDAFHKGFDCILLPDCCGTASPEYATLSVVYNCEKALGFVSDGERLEMAVVAGHAPL